MSDYFDLQVNGYGGIDFNQDDLTAEQLHAACERLRADGVTGFLATVITDHIPVMAARLGRLAQLRGADPLARQLISGFHIEGPFLNETDGYRGAHPADAIQPANLDATRRLLEAGAGLTRLVTLAPERDPGLAVTKQLVGQGIVVSAGHCNPTIDQLRGAVDAGLTMFTHLGNGCPRQLPRHDNIIQRALSLADRLWLCFIADGVHVPFYALRNYLNVAGLNRCIIVTDAMAAAGLGPGRYRLARWEVVVGEDRAAWAPDRSHLVGAAITMPQLDRNLREQLGLAATDCHRLLSDNPRQALGQR
jgi:N-acetylglucosamine-6-phosphate deacetylase